MGTSLQVQPFARLVCQVKQTTPRLLVSSIVMRQEEHSCTVHCQQV